MNGLQQLTDNHELASADNGPSSYTDNECSASKNDDDNGNYGDGDDDDDEQNATEQPHDEDVRYAAPGASFDLDQGQLRSRLLDRLAEMIAYA